MKRKKQTDFGKKVQRKLKKLGMMQTDLAQKMGVSKQRVNNIIHDPNEPGTLTIRKVYAAFGEKSPV